MKHQSSLCLIILLLSIAIFSSCSKDDSDNYNASDKSYKGKLHKIITYVAGDSAFCEFKYDVNGRITDILQKFSDDDFMQTLSMVRNLKGQVITCFDREDKRYSETYAYTIGSDGKYVSAQITISDFGNNYQEIDNYTYSGNQITKIERYKNNKLILETTLKYDNRGNIIERKVYGTDGMSYISVDGKEEFKYDTRINPIGSLDFPYFFYFLFAFSPNNILSEKGMDSDGSFIYDQFSFEYSYDKSGKPVSAVYTSGSDYSLNFQYVYY